MNFTILLKYIIKNLQIWLRFRERKFRKPDITELVCDENFTSRVAKKCSREYLCSSDMLIRQRWSNALRSFVSSLTVFVQFFLAETKTSTHVAYVYKKIDAFAFFDFERKIFSFFSRFQMTSIQDQFGVDIYVEIWRSSELN